MWLYCTATPDIYTYCHQLALHDAVPIGPAVSPFAARASWIVPSQTSSSAVVRQFGVGKLPTIPAWLAAITNSGPDTKNIGAATIGSRVPKAKPVLIVRPRSRQAHPSSSPRVGVSNWPGSRCTPRAANFWEGRQGDG